MTEVEKNQMKYCLYARKSTEAEEKQALSIDSQIKEMKQVAERENLTIVEIRKNHIVQRNLDKDLYLKRS
jgi:DNA invertase Pin-like site-specific DNA recombinase